MTTPEANPTSCPVPPSCDNLGFDWAYYNSSARNNDKTYSSFRPVTFKKTKPVYTQITRFVGGSGMFGPASQGSRSGIIYGSKVDLKWDYFAVNHHAYLYACEAGTYHITVPYANDAVDIWVGAKAYSGWTDGNADAKARYNQADHIAGHANFTFNVPEATYMPIRFFFGQAQLGGVFLFNITTPTGQVIVSDSESGPYVVRHSCDGATAPKFPAFGSEV